MIWPEQVLAGTAAQMEELESMIKNKETELEKLLKGDPERVPLRQEVAALRQEKVELLKQQNAREGVFVAHTILCCTQDPVSCSQLRSAAACSICTQLQHMQLHHAAITVMG